MEVQAFPLSELLGGGRRHEPAKLPLAEAQIATLKEAFERYASPCPFKAGEIITVRAGSPMYGAGIPHIVLEVYENPFVVVEASDPSETTNARFGSRLDMRVASRHEASGKLDAWMVESWMFERYDARVHDVKDIGTPQGAA